MEYDLIKKRNLEFFNKTLKESEDEHGAVGQSERSHLKRFEKIFNIGDWNGKSVLDIGCGLGGFYDFLLKKCSNFEYTGFDINEFMIKEAKIKYKKIEKRFNVKDILEEPIEETFDYVVSVGPLNLKFSGEENLDLTRILLKKMYDISRIGFAISMTSSLSMKKHNDTFYYDPVIIISYLSEFCMNFRLDHSYLPHDFVVFGYKKNLYD